MMPPSITMVSFGAWRCWASAAASSGTPTPANTVVSSRSTREPWTASSSEGVIIGAGSARPAQAEGGLSETAVAPIGAGSARSALAAGGLGQARGAPLARSLRELLGQRALVGQPLAAKQLEVIIPARRAVHIARQVVAHSVLDPACIDGRGVRAEVIEVRLVEAVALVRIRAEGDVHERIDEKAGNHGAIGMTARLLVGDQLLRGHEHRRRRARDVGIHVRIAVDLAIAEAIRAVHVE